MFAVRISIGTKGWIKIIEGVVQRDNRWSPECFIVEERDISSLERNLRINKESVCWKWQHINCHPTFHVYKTSTVRSFYHFDYANNISNGNLTLTRISNTWSRYCYITRFIRCLWNLLTHSISQNQTICNKFLKSLIVNHRHLS